MNTVRITKHENGWSCEFHGSGLILSEDYFARDAGRMVQDAAEWCSRTNTLQELVASPQKPPEPLIRQCPTCFGRDGIHQDPCQKTRMSIDGAQGIILPPPGSASPTCPDCDDNRMTWQQEGLMAGQWYCCCGGYHKPLESPPMSREDGEDLDELNAR